MKTSLKMYIAKYLSKFILNFLSESKFITTRNNLKWKLDLNEAIDLSIFLFGKFEPSIQNIVRKILFDFPDYKNIIDIGANCGSHTLNFASEFKQIKVIAIEPTLYCYNKLKKNLLINPNIKKRVVTLQAFVSNHKKIPNNVYSSWELSSKKQKHSKHMGIKKSTKNAKIFSLDKIVDQYMIQSSIIKCDVDGHELFVFQSGLKYLKKYKPKIVMELAPYLYKENGYSSKDLFSLLKKFDYDFYDGATYKKILDINEYSSKIPSRSSKNIFLI